jgi:cell division protein FtsI/penicillin-binding protein 2
VGGKPFRNADSAALGSIAFSEAFAQSCNTAFVQLAARLSDADLSEAAEKFGFGAAYELPLPVAGGRFPDPRDNAERAAQAIGQGRVEVSPLHLATVAAAVASGSWQPPRLLAGQKRDRGRRLGADSVRTLRRLMRLVVAAGTGRAAAVAGQEVSGKTGTAEFGTQRPPRTHAWFAGFRGRLAFAVFVEGGGAGGEAAAPLVARFLASLGD